MSSETKRKELLETLKCAIKKEKIANVFCENVIKLTLDLSNTCLKRPKRFERSASFLIFDVDDNYYYCLLFAFFGHFGLVDLNQRARTWI